MATVSLSSVGMSRSAVPLGGSDGVSLRISSDALVWTATTPVITHLARLFYPTNGS